LAAVLRRWLCLKIAQCSQSMLRPGELRRRLVRVSIRVLVWVFVRVFVGVLAWSCAEAQLRAGQLCAGKPLQPVQQRGCGFAPAAAAAAAPAAAATPTAAAASGLVVTG
jgi:hypothetical protein